ncbi:hypothetical protein D3C85_1673090 [compost metagenome]
MAGTTSEKERLVMSAVKPVSGGTMAPPTMAQQISPEPSAAREPRPSDARAKIVGNMTELKRPMARIAQPAVEPLELAATVIRAITTAAAAARILPGAK